MGKDKKVKDVPTKKLTKAERVDAQLKDHEDRIAKLETTLELPGVRAFIESTTATAADAGDALR